jgi:hypothetical protein
MITAAGFRPEILGDLRVSLAQPLMNAALHARQPLDRKIGRFPGRRLLPHGHVEG